MSIPESQDDKRVVNLELHEGLPNGIKLAQKSKPATKEALGNSTPVNSIQASVGAPSKSHTTEDDKMEDESYIRAVEGNIEGSRSEDGKFVSFIKENITFFIAFSMLNFTMAVLLTLLCFIFPNAIGNAKDAAGYARDWAKPKLDAGINFGLSLPKLGLGAMKFGGKVGLDAMKTGGTNASEIFFRPFSWTWRFLKCFGTCSRLDVPRIPLWLSCMVNCFKKK